MDLCRFTSTDQTILNVHLLIPWTVFKSFMSMRENLFPFSTAAAATSQQGNSSPNQTLHFFHAIHSYMFSNYNINYSHIYTFKIEFRMRYYNEIARIYLTNNWSRKSKQFSVNIHILTSSEVALMCVITFIYRRKISSRHTSNTIHLLLLL